MTIVHPPQTDVNADSLEALDWAPACEFSNHERYGTGPADWAVYFRPMFACGCRRPRLLALWCDGCLTRPTAVRTVCPGCRTTFPLAFYVARTEAI